MSSGTAAVLFDIDDTLVDANSLHIHPWCRAFAEVGVGVQSWRIHRSIGMDGSELVKSLAAAADENAQKRASELHSRYYSAVGLDWPGRGEGRSDRQSGILALVAPGEAVPTSRR